MATPTFSLSAARKKVASAAAAPVKKAPPPSPVVEAEEEEDAGVLSEEETMPPARAPVVKKVAPPPPAPAEDDMDDEMTRHLAQFEAAAQKPKAKAAPPAPAAPLKKKPVARPPTPPAEESDAEEKETDALDTQEMEDARAIEQTQPRPSLSDEEDEAPAGTQAPEPSMSDAEGEEEVPPSPVKPALKSKIKLPAQAPPPASPPPTKAALPPKGVAKVISKESPNKALSSKSAGPIISADNLEKPLGTTARPAKKEKVSILDTLKPDASLDEMYEAMGEEEDYDDVSDDRIRDLNKTPEELRAMQIASLRNTVQLKENQPDYFLRYEFMPKSVKDRPAVVCNSLTEYLQGKDLEWQGISVQFLIAPESKRGGSTGGEVGRYAKSNCIYVIPRLNRNRPPITAGDEKIPGMTMKTGPVWVQGATAFVWGSHLDKTREKITKAYQTAAYDNVRKASHEISFNTRGYKYLGYCKEDVVTKDGKTTTVMRNRQAKELCTTYRLLEFALLRFLIGTYIEANDTRGGGVLAEGRVLNSTSPLHDAVNSYLNQKFIELKAKKPNTLTCWKDMLRLGEYFPQLLDMFVYDVARGAAFSTSVIRTDSKVRKDYLWSLDSTELDEYTQMFSARLPVFRHRGPDEQPSEYHRKYPKLLALFGAPDKDNTRKPPEDLGGTVYQFPRITNFWGDKLDPMHFDTEEKRGQRLATGTIVNATLGIRFITNTAKRCHFQFKWYDTKILMDSLVMSANREDEERKLDEQMEGRELFVQPQRETLKMLEHSYMSNHKSDMYDPTDMAIGKLTLVADPVYREQLMLEATESLRKDTSKVKLLEN